MISRWSFRLSLSPRAVGGCVFATALGLAACTSAGPPKPPPPAIQEGIKDLGTPQAVPSPGARPPAGAPQANVPPPPQAPIAPTSSIPAAPPTLPPVVVQAISTAPQIAPDLEAGELPTGRELADGMIAALNRAQTARLVAKLPNAHSTDLQFAAPDRAALVEQDENGQEYARYVIIGDTGYVYEVRGGGWRKVVNEGYRKQTQIFRPMQIALAVGKALPLDSGAEVEQVEMGGKPALRAVFDYGSSEELQDLGLMRSNGNRLEVIVDPTTWLPLKTREETETGGPEKAVTEVTFVDFDQPVTVEAPIS